ncbi:MAG: hypothetical protein ACLUIQ_03830 [Dialister invisus]
MFWGIGDKDPCCPGDIVDIVYEPEIHDWYGKHVQLICKDIRPVKDYFNQRFSDRCVCSSKRIDS